MTEHEQLHVAIQRRTARFVVLAIHSASLDFTVTSARGEASGANLGWLTLSTKPVGVLLDLARLSMRLYRGFDTIEPRACFQRTGGMVCAVTEAELAAREDLTRRQAEAGVNVAMISAE